MSSSKSPSELEADETAQKRAQADQFAFDVDAPGLVEVTNESHENPAAHQYVVSIDDVTEELMACTCPHHVHRSAYCKHTAAVENATVDGSLNAFLSVYNNNDHVGSPHTGYDTDGTVDHTFWQGENCGAEATRKDALTDCC
ncbi:SWIM zinc finger family protein [Haladaptatus litoreus]|uniref:SWIM zinc finger family protein n=1 Tax=Haladaptatus litoreus TaxID=553468 RepID=UPI001FE4429C|nr:SWIM zinc finger family protein [Haladaptatus litoreus]